MQITPEHGSKPESPASKEKLIKPADFIITDLCFLYAEGQEVLNKAKLTLEEIMPAAKFETAKKHGKLIVELIVPPDNHTPCIWMDEHHNVVFVEVGITIIKPGATRNEFLQKFTEYVGNGGFVGISLKPKSYILGQEMSDELLLRNILWGKLCGQINNRLHEHLAIPPHLHSTHVFWVPMTERLTTQEVICNILNRALERRAILAKEGEHVWKGLVDNLNEMADEYFSTT